VPTPKKKVTLYFNAGLLEETQREAIRQDRSISWIIQAAWRLARDEVRRLPDVSGARAPLGAVAAVPAVPAVPAAAPPAPPAPPVAYSASAAIKARGR
jgi:uncharacterized small protein (TIGR04563 family)